MKQILKVIITVAMIILFACSTQLLITTHKTIMIVPMIYSLGIGIVIHFGLFKAWYKRAVLDNSMPIVQSQDTNKDWNTNRLHPRSVVKAGAYNHFLGNRAN